MFWLVEIKFSASGASPEGITVILTLKRAILGGGNGFY
jgi:hypothetical protein